MVEQAQEVTDLTVVGGGSRENGDRFGWRAGGSVWFHVLGTMWKAVFQ